MAGDTRGSDTVHTRYARKGTPTAMHVGQRMPSLELSHQGRRGQPGRSRPGKPPIWCGLLVSTELKVAWEVGEEGVAGDGGSGDNGGRAGLGHRLVAAWARVRAAFGDG